MTVHCILRQESKIIPSVKAVLAVLRLHTYIIVHLRGKNAARLLPIYSARKKSIKCLKLVFGKKKNAKIMLFF